MSPVLETAALTRHYRLPRQRLFQPPEHVYALNGVSLTVVRGRNLGVVGESGCGKSTLARVAVGLDRPTGGAVKLLGQDPYTLPREALRRLRRHVQMVFQDPYGSLDPRRSVGWSVAEPLGGMAPAERRQRAAETLAEVGLRPGDLDKYPHEFSGGQRQRIAVARALVTRPDLIVADEPVSSLDVSVQAQILNLLHDLSARHGVTFLFISHDLAVVATLCAEVAVMYLGRVVEQGDTRTVFDRPLHPYTIALLEAVPRAVAGSRRRPPLPGQAPVQTSLPAGCAFAPRCARADDLCRAEVPALRPLDSRLVACHHAGQ
ncbi:MAG: ATP-binding cassette domain-containing protein [Thalassobaculales bacterium]